MNLGYFQDHRHGISLHPLGAHHTHPAKCFKQILQSPSFQALQGRAGFVQQAVLIGSSQALQTDGHEESQKKWQKQSWYTDYDTQGFMMNQNTTSFYMQKKHSKARKLVPSRSQPPGDLKKSYGGSFPPVHAKRMEAGSKATALQKG